MKVDNIRQIVEEYLKDTSLFPVTVTLSDSNRISVLIDGDSGVKVSDCMGLNRHLEKELDRDKEDFSLEVSSYGVGSPLLMPRQYIKNTGRLLEVHTLEGERFTGRINTADEEGVEMTIQPEGKRARKAVPQEVIRISYDQIDRSVIMIEF